MGEWDAPHLSRYDDAIMPCIDLCNIACGAHAGNSSIMESTIQLAKEHNVKVGAHPGFEDRINFGRKYIKLPATELKDSLSRQIDTFLTICHSKNCMPHHIKTHGALYHACNENEREANLLIEVILSLCPQVVVVLKKGSLLEKRALEKGIATMSESFIDRRYNEDLTLMSRTKSDAVITDVVEATMQFQDLVNGRVKVQGGEYHSLRTDTACIHGDNPNCLSILNAILQPSNV